MLRAKRLLLPLVLSAASVVCASSLSFPVPSQDSPQDQSQQKLPAKSATDNNKGHDQKDKKAKAANKQARAQSAAPLPAALWHDPGDIASLDLVNGQGGSEHAPNPNARYTFIKEDTNGTSPKFYVKDSDGVEWLVKLGQEPKPETAATRFVWAMGYYTDEDYFVPKIHVSPTPKLTRKAKDLSADGTAVNVRLKRQSASGSEKIANWDWHENPFLDTREFNGLRVMMAVLNNWDLKTVNNKIYVTDTERRYVVSDLGASFGKTGGVTTRSKGVLKDYEDSAFIKDRKDDTISFEMRTRPLPLLAPLEPKNFEQRSRMEEIEDDIPIADAAWLGTQLARLTPQQIADAFRTAGFSPQEVQSYSIAIQKRIADLNSLQGTPASSLQH